MLTKIADGYYTATVSGAHVIVTHPAKATWEMTAYGSFADGTPTLALELLPSLKAVKTMVSDGTLAALIAAGAAEETAKSAAALPKMNDKQAATVALFTKLMSEKDPTKELKQYEVTSDASTGLVFVIIEYGLPGSDKAELADHRHVLIGLRGGIQLLNASNLRKDVGMHNAVWARVK